MSVDNNASERDMRPVAMGRSNYLFFQNMESGERHAILYTRVKSAEKNGLNPTTYLADVLVRVHSHPQRRLEDLLQDAGFELLETRLCPARTHGLFLVGRHEETLRTIPPEVVDTQPGQKDITRQAGQRDELTISRGTHRHDNGADTFRSPCESTTS